MVEKIGRLKTEIENEQVDDLELVERVRGGDRSAFSQLVRRHQKGLMRMCMRFMKDVDSAEDVVQESFIKSYERLHSFEGRASFKSWLYQIAVNTAKNRLRDRGKGFVTVDDLPLVVSAQAETTLVHGAVAELIQKYVDELPMKQKTALVLRIYEDLSFKEIAEIMDCPYDTAKANYRHALMKLKDELSNQPDLRHWTEETGGFFMEIHRKVAEAES
jgi:RNA polymerase sigma-70 factor (ECF subfamily)